MPLDCRFDGNEIGPFSCPGFACLISVAMSVGASPMIAIPFAIILSPVAMILRQTQNLSCNQFAHAMPMIAIPRPVHYTYNNGPFQEGYKLHVVAFRAVESRFSGLGRIVPWTMAYDLHSLEFSKPRL